MRRSSSILCMLLLSFALGAKLNMSLAKQSELGVVRLENSGALAAQADFQRGLAALHSFWYDEARIAFQKAQSIDSDFALAYWGEALTYDFPFGSSPDVDEARAVLNRFGKTPALRQRKAKTNLEKRLLAAVDALYGEGDRPTREQAYYEQMKLLYESNVDNVEIASFYALSVLGKIVLGRDLREKVEVVAILEPFFSRYPNHPGVLHYMIHAYDDAILAPLGLRAANLYASAAPASSHALHMPSHIFLQLGMWDRTTTSNIDAYKASIETAKNRGRGVEAYDTHALMWLIYSRTMEGAIRDARSYLDEARDIRDQSGDTGIAFEYALMATRYAVETSDWSAALPPSEADSFENPVVKGGIYIAAGLRAIYEDDLETAAWMISRIASLETVSGVVDNPRRLRITRISRLLVEAALDQRRGDLQDAIDKAKEAAALETELPLPIGPDFPTLVANERYGDLLLQIGDPSAAIEVYKVALSRRAKRPPALFGLLKAATSVGDQNTASLAYDQLMHIWKSADDGFKPAQEMETIRGK